MPVYRKKGNSIVRTMLATGIPAREGAAAEAGRKAQVSAPKPASIKSRDLQPNTPFNAHERETFEAARTRGEVPESIADLAMRKRYANYLKLVDEWTDDVEREAFELHKYMGDKPEDLSRLNAEQKKRYIEFLKMYERSGRADAIQQLK